MLTGIPVRASMRALLGYPETMKRVLKLVIKSPFLALSILPHVSPVLAATSKVPHSCEDVA